jgi:hypothetical protein
MNGEQQARKNDECGATSKEKQQAGNNKWRGTTCKEQTNKE